jgi:hypothetical protein
MQSMASDGQYWIFAQIQQTGRFGLSHAQHLAAGDLTLTRISPTGEELGHMFLNGFGHGVSIGAERQGDTVWVWTETVAMDGYGTRIARFPWVGSETLSTSDVPVYAPNPSSTHHTVSLSLGDGLVGSRYASSTTGDMRIARYLYTDFLQQSYPALSRTTQPSVLDGRISQGWVLLPGGETFAQLCGKPYSAINPAPGNTMLTIFGLDGTVISDELVAAGSGLRYRALWFSMLSQGVLRAGAAGPPHGRRANLYRDPPGTSPVGTFTDQLDVQVS